VLSNLFQTCQRLVQRIAKMPHDIFISHSSKDKQAADAACATLEKNGIRCWIAPRDVEVGKDYADEIDQAIENCRAIVIIFSSHSNLSGQVKREIDSAIAHGKTLFTIRIEDIEPTKGMAHYLRTVHWLDAFTPPMEKHLRELAKMILRLYPDRIQPNTPVAVTSAQTATLINTLGEVAQPFSASSSLSKEKFVVRLDPKLQPPIRWRLWLFILVAILAASATIEGLYNGDPHWGFGLGYFLWAAIHILIFWIRNRAKRSEAGIASKINRFLEYCLILPSAHGLIEKTLACFCYITISFSALCFNSTGEWAAAVLVWSVIPVGVYWAIKAFFIKKRRHLI